MFDNGWYCSPECLETAIRERLSAATAGPTRSTGAPTTPLKLGMVLVHQGVVTNEAMRKALEDQRESGLKLGEQLQRQGLVTSHDLLRALAGQWRVDYLTAVNLEQVRSGPGDLSRETVRALRVVPFELDLEKKRLKVACLAPIPRSALTAIRDMTGWEAAPFLVADDQWPALVEAYGTERPAETGQGTIGNLQEAIARIANAAGEGRAARMAFVRCDPYIWCRLEGPGGAEDLVMRAFEHPEEQKWLAAPTSR